MQLELYNLQYKIYGYAKKNNIGLVRKSQRELVNRLENKHIIYWILMVIKLERFGSFMDTVMTKFTQLKKKPD